MKSAFPCTTRATTWAAAVATGCVLAGCSTVDNFFSGDKVDYRSQAARTTPLEVPPDLTQLARDGRYQPVQGSVSAAALAAAPAPANTAPTAGAPANSVAPAALGEFRIERLGNQRVLKTGLTPEQLWPQLRAFWQGLGFNIDQDNAAVGVMDTNWSENRALLPKDGIRKLFGGILDALYSTGERDRFRTRVERVGDSTEVLITHRGMEEIYQGVGNDRTVWRARPSDPQLEAEMLSRLLVKLGAREDVARTTVTAVNVAPATAARARLVAVAAGTTLEVDDPFDRTWRRVGVALDRAGFTVEDRDRNAGLYFVRYVDPALAGKEEPGFFSRLFSGDKANAAPVRVRINVAAAGDKSLVNVLNSQGAPDKSDVARRIATLLVDDLKQ